MHITICEKIYSCFVDFKKKILTQFGMTDFYLLQMNADDYFFILIKSL